MATMVVSEIEFQEHDAQRLSGFALDAPRPGDACDAWVLEFEGWVLGRGASIGQVEVWDGPRLLRSAPASVARPDVGALFPEAVNASQCGFHVGVNMLGLDAEFRLDLVVRLDDGAGLCLARIAGRRQSLRTAYQPRRQPIAIMALGRSGTTLLQHLLAEHPQVLVHCRYPFEPIAAIHGLRTCRILTTPSNPVRQDELGRLAQAGAPAYPMPLFCKYEAPELHAWLRREYIERWADFTLETIDAFYDVVARTQQRPDADYFCEKLLNIKQDAQHVSTLFREFYPDLKEIFLIRDFRDLVCSKRSFAALHRPEASPMTELIRKTARRSRGLFENWQARASRALLIRYEELVRQPVETTQKILDYLALDAGRPLAERLWHRMQHDSGIGDRHRTVSDPMKSIGRWRRELSPAEQEQCARELGQVLEAFGYANAA